MIVLPYIICNYIRIYVVTEKVAELPLGFCRRRRASVALAAIASVPMAHFQLGSFLIGLVSNWAQF